MVGAGRRGHTSGDWKVKGHILGWYRRAEEQIVVEIDVHRVVLIVVLLGEISIPDLKVYSRDDNIKGIPASDCERYRYSREFRDDNL